MITIEIGMSKNDINEVSESWIREQINRRREDGQAICVRVRIRTGSLDFSLATAGCGRGRGRGATPREQKFLNLWKRHGLTEPDFSGESLVAFLRQLSNVLG